MNKIIYTKNRIYRWCVLRWYDICALITFWRIGK